MRIMVPNEAQMADMKRQGAEGADGENGIGSLPSVCFRLEDCAAHRCSAHSEVNPLNEACEFDSFAECGACAYEAGIQEGLRRARRAS